MTAVGSDCVETRTGLAFRHDVGGRHGLKSERQFSANLGRSLAAEASVTNWATRPFVILYATAHVGPNRSDRVLR